MASIADELTRRRRRNQAGAAELQLPLTLAVMAVSVIVGRTQPALAAWLLDERRSPIMNDETGYVTQLRPVTPASADLDVDELVVARAA